jgi:hypothetical protein
MFTWTHPDDESVTITLPPQGDIPAGVWRRIRNKPEIDMMFELIEAVADPAELAKIDALPTRLLAELFGAWGGGVGAPESSGSST